MENSNISITEDNGASSDNEILELEYELTALIAEYGSEHLNVVNCLERLADSHRKKYNWLDAERFYHRVLAMREKTLGFEHPDVAVVLSKLAGLLLESGNYSDSEPFYRRSLEIRLKCYGTEHPKVAIVMSNLATLLRILGLHSESESLYRRALDICEKIYGIEHPDVASILSSLANLLQDSGNFSESEICCRRALEICKKSYGPEHPEVSSKLTSLAILLHDTGNYSEAEAYYRNALDSYINAFGAEHPDVACVLVNLANLLQDLGNYSESELYYRRALEIWEHLYGKVHPHVITVLNNLANLLQDLGSYSEAEPLYRRALESTEKTYGVDNPEVAISLCNLANLLYNIENFSEAEPLYQRALKIWVNIYGLDHSDVALVMNNLASMLIKLGRYSEAEHFCHSALQIREKIYGSEHKDVAASLLCCSRLMTGKGHLSAAIFFGKRAINILQIIRSNVSLITKETLNLYERKIEKNYHTFTEVLIKADRLLEAEHVLGLLKEDDFFDFIRRDLSIVSTTLSGISYNKDEAILNSKYNSISQSLFSRFISLKTLKKNNYCSPSEELEYLDQQARLEELSDKFKLFLNGLHEDLSQEKSFYENEVANFMSTLWELDEKTAVIYTLSTNDTLYTILVTKNFRKSFSYAISSVELSKKILLFRNMIMKRDKFDVEPMAYELYEIIFEQLSNELEKSKISNLLWMLEGSLRLLPISALHNGNEYIVNLFRNVYLTTKSQVNLKSTPKQKWTALGMGVTLAHENFNSLPAVKEELERIINIGGMSRGILSGEILLDGDFTWDAMTNQLNGDYQAVHIASHFNLDPCNETRSYLLLGDGNHLTLDKLKNQQDLFYGVDLLALSACSTGLGLASKHGREIDGIGYIAETLGAKTVIASLWPVDDESTSLLMTEFYRKRETGVIKIEALRQAQLDMLNGSTKPTNPSTERSGAEPFRFEVDRENPYAHPYYWAPFILIGNYR